MRKLTFVLLAMFAYSSCSKDSNSYVNVCRGISEDTYLPLKVGNTWYYETETGSFSEIDSVIGYNGVEFYLYSRAFIKSSTGINPFGTPITDTLVVEDNGDISKKFNGGKVLVLPASPSNGQTWRAGNYPYYTTFRVLNKNATTTTSLCRYPSSLQFSITAGDSTVSYYKKGIGLVRQDLFLNPTNFYNLQIDLFLTKVILR